MAQVILGLLLIAPHSLYDLVKSFRASVSLFYSASAGSIKRAVDVLLDRGHIEIASEEPGARGRKVYRVTEAGRKAFEEWMVDIPATGDAETAILARLHFLGLLAEDDRPAVLAAIRHRISAGLDELLTLDQGISQQPVPQHQQAVATFRLKTLEYGIASHRFALQWFDELAEGMAGGADRR